MFEHHFADVVQVTDDDRALTHPRYQAQPVLDLRRGGPVLETTPSAAASAAERLPGLTALMEIDYLDEILQRTIYGQNSPENQENTFRFHLQ